MDFFLKKKEDARWDLVAPTSMGVRLAPDGRQQVSRSYHFTMQATSAESNVLSVPAALGQRTEALTAFVKDSPISSFIKSEMRKRGIAYEGPDRDQGGPWGLRHQINFTESGVGGRGSQVANDRAGEVGRTLSADDFDLDRIFGEEGVRILHMSGLFDALSPQSGDFCLKLARAAKKYGTRISFDMNYRASFWKGREKELGRIFRSLAEEADILMNFQLLDEDGMPVFADLDPERPETFEKLMEGLQKAYPGASIITSTVRKELSACANKWGAIVLSEGKWYRAPLRRIDVLDRIGGGDGFASGFLYGLLSGYDLESCLQLGWAAGAMAVTVLTDYAEPESEQVLRRIWQGSADVQR